jgi:hypothetical protein
MKVEINVPYEVRRASGERVYQRLISDTGDASSKRHSRGYHVSQPNCHGPSVLRMLMR